MWQSVSGFFSEDWKALVFLLIVLIMAVLCIAVSFLYGALTDDEGGEVYMNTVGCCLFAFFAVGLIALCVTDTLGMAVAGTIAAAFAGFFMKHRRKRGHRTGAVH